MSGNCGFLQNLTWAGTSNPLKLMPTNQPGRKERQEPSGETETLIPFSSHSRCPTHASFSPPPACA
jgi:hypothetical protein